MSVEIPRERQIKNIGMRPHNLPYSQIVEIMQGNTDDGKLGVLMLKPGCFSISGHSSTQEQTEELISSHKLDVVATSCTVLTREQIHGIYPNIFGPTVVALTDRLDELRILMEDYLSNCVFTYLVYGDNSLNGLIAIKRILRQNTIRAGNWDVHNLVHVPNQEDLIQNRDVLFNHVNCSVCSINEND